MEHNIYRVKEKKVSVSDPLIFSMDIIYDTQEIYIIRDEFDLNDLKKLLT